MIGDMSSPFDVHQRVLYQQPMDRAWRTGRVGNYPPCLGVEVYDDETGRAHVVSSDHVRALTDEQLHQLETYGELRPDHHQTEVPSP